MSDVMIEAKDLVKRYDDVVALNQVSMQVRKGEVLGFLGPNGAGKSTTMKILTCFTAPTEGTASINGCDIFDNSLGVRQAIGYLPESTALYPDMLVLEYLDFIAEMRGVQAADRRKRIKGIIEQTGLGDVFAKQIRALSKGFRQRVGLAQALVHEPPVLILDEPMSGLDPHQAVEIRDLIKEIGRARTVILSTHNLAEVQVACDRVLIIAKGKIVADDTPDGLQDRAGKSRFVATVKDGEDAAKQAETAFADLAGVERVRKLDSDEGEHSFELLPKGSEDLRADIFKAAVDSKLTLLGLRREGQNLEQIFRQLTTQQASSGSESKATESKEKAA